MPVSVALPSADAHHGMKVTATTEEGVRVYVSMETSSDRWEWVEQAQGDGGVARA